MLYDYKCDNCDFLMEDVYQSIKEDALTKCPECKKQTLQRVPYGGTYACVKQEPTTIGQLLERRYEEGNKYTEDGRPITKIEWNKSDMVERHEKREYEKRERAKANKAKREKSAKINKMTPEQRRNYIINGD